MGIINSALIYRFLVSKSYRYYLYLTKQIVLFMYVLINGFQRNKNRISSCILLGKNINISYEKRNLTSAGKNFHMVCYSKIEEDFEDNKNLHDYRYAFF